MKALTIIGSVLLFSMLFLTAISPSCMTAVYGAGGTGVFCPNNFQQGLDTEDEIEISYATCLAIHQMLSSYGDNEENEWRCNSAVTYTTWGTVLDYLVDECDYATIFSKGHCTPCMGGDHYRLVDYSATITGANDSIHILPYIDSNNDFVFIWHCGTAQNYPSWSDAYGYVGMPYAFTKDNSMDEYGTSGDRVYLGWDWASPQFESEIHWQWPDEDWIYAQFAYLTFENLCDGLSVANALNLASIEIGNTSFWYTDDYGELIAFGDWTLGLP